MEDKRRKAVNWINKKYYPPRSGNHFRLIVGIFFGVVIVMSLVIVLLIDFGDDIDLYFSSMRNQFYLVMGIVGVLLGFTVWYWFRRYRNF